MRISSSQGSHAALKQLALCVAVAVPFSPTRALAQQPLVKSSPAASEGGVNVNTRLARAARLVQVATNTKGHLKEAIALYEETQKNWPQEKAKRVLLWTDLSRAWLRLGDLYSKKNPDRRVAAFEKGRKAAHQALVLDKNNADALFWDMANLAKLGKTRGVTQSLFMAKELKQKLRRVLQLDPSHNYARQTLARLQYKIPNLLGGDDDEGKALLKECLRLDPNFTPCMWTLADFYVDDGQKEKAIALLRKVISAGATTSKRDDWKKFSLPASNKLLRELESKR